jgi:hypothetical protein
MMLMWGNVSFQGEMCLSDTQSNTNFTWAGLRGNMNIHSEASNYPLELWHSWIVLRY